MFFNWLYSTNTQSFIVFCVSDPTSEQSLVNWLRCKLSIQCCMKCNNICLFFVGSLSIGFSYTRQKFKWKVARYSYTTTVFSLLNCFATVVIVPILNKKLCVHEAAVGLIGILSLMSKMVLLASAAFEWVVPYGMLYKWFLLLRIRNVYKIHKFSMH